MRNEKGQGRTQRQTENKYETVGKKGGKNVQRLNVNVS